MAEHDALLAVHVFFGRPTRMDVAPLPPLFKSGDDASLVPAFMSRHIVVTRVAYTLVALSLASGTEPIGEGTCSQRARRDEVAPSGRGDPDDGAHGQRLPIHFGNPNGTVPSLMRRPPHSSEPDLRMRVGAYVASARRDGHGATFEALKSALRAGGDARGLARPLAIM